jgi:hypothetical protein
MREMQKAYDELQAVITPEQAELEERWPRARVCTKTYAPTNAATLRKEVT